MDLNVLYRIVVKTGDQPSVIVTECPIFRKSETSYAVDCEGGKFSVGLSQLNTPDVGPLGFYYGYNIEIPQYVYMWCGRQPTVADIKECVEYHTEIIGNAATRLAELSRIAQNFARSYQ